MILIDGYETESLPVSDRGLQFGDGCFTTALILEGKIGRLQAHLQRLEEACERLAIPFTDWQVLAQEMQTRAATQQRGVLKVVITRGSGGRGYSTTGCSQPRRIVSVAAYPAQYDQWRKQGISLLTCPMRLGINPVLAGIKHLNRLEQVMIRQFIDQSAAEEALVLDCRERIIECCSANIFWRSGEQLFTPRVDEAGVNGTMRRYLIRLLAEQGYDCQEVRAGLPALQQADEVFICNSLMPVVPVTRVDTVTYSPGTLTHRLSELCYSPG